MAIFKVGVVRGPGELWGRGRSVGREGVVHGWGALHNHRESLVSSRQGRDGLCYTWRGTMRPHRQLGDQPVQQILWRRQVDVSRASSSQRLPSALCKESEAASQGTQEHCNRLAMSALGTQWNA